MGTYDDLSEKKLRTYELCHTYKVVTSIYENEYGWFTNIREGEFEVVEAVVAYFKIWSQPTMVGYFSTLLHLVATHRSIYSF